ncbi:MAG: sirohydrochlorin cobaltochelatase [Synergistaceae bacterium]|nr:sirohydrochlorin cobaltochelatase [Synergistaceae bacterium]
MKLGRTFKALLLAGVSSLAFAGAAFAFPQDASEINIKKGILLVAFGSSMPEGEAAITAVRDAVSAANPGIEVRTAYTSRIIMRKLARGGRFIDEPAIALARMAFEGFTDVAVLSTHIIPGAEFDDLAAVVKGFKLMSDEAPKAGFRYISLSAPLLSCEADFERIADILADTYEKEIGEGAVILIGHGTHHFADAAYSALQIALWRRSPNFFVGTVEGILNYEDVSSGLKSTNLKKLHIGPAMLVAGDHAHNDIAGDEPDSWRSMLEAEGYEVTPIMTGWGQNEAIREMILDKLREAWGDE